MDGVDRQLVGALRANGRASWAELGRLVGMSGPSVQERVRRLEEQGVIIGYQAVVSAPAFGLSVSALVDLYEGDDVDGDVVDQLRDIVEVEDCWYVAGDENFVVKVRAADVAGLESVVAKLRKVRGISRTRTTVVLATNWEGRTLPPVVDPEPAAAAPSGSTSVG
ncbi:Lrp/AsnC family transcriptional regulator [Angustibacter sp. McL0619]|uniref:Lrp/AsnC family transcriptional regulator n=1 Tax=Angustibacter sp. McL0619 TaxID=3415676 RepID=UPI003CF87FCA